MAMLVNSLLVLRIGINTADRSVEFLGLAFLAISGGMLLIGATRRCELAAKAHARARPCVMAACAACVVLIALASVVAMVH